jgi:ABC transporter substrate binding protein
LGLQIRVHNADTSREISAAFAGMARERPDALFVGPGPFFVARRVQLAQLAACGRTDQLRSHAWRQVGVYAGRILKGAKPSELPVVQSAKFELVINAETARMLDLTVPPTLLARADEVIE